MQLVCCRKRSVTISFGLYGCTLELGHPLLCDMHGHRLIPLDVETQIPLLTGLTMIHEAQC